VEKLRILFNILNFEFVGFNSIVKKGKAIPATGREGP
jgi:hypothetical protein